MTVFFYSDILLMGDDTETLKSPLLAPALTPYD